MSRSRDAATLVDVDTLGHSPPRFLATGGRGRRRVALAVVLPLVFAAACSGEPSSSPDVTSTTVAARPTTSAVTPVRRLLLVGDSVMDELAPAVRAALAGRTDVRYVLTIGAVGVPPDWDAVWPKAIDEHRPDAVAVLVGAWEGRDLPDVPFGSPAWIGWYRSRLDGWARALSAGGATVWWFGSLPVRDPEAEPRFVVLDREYRALAERFAAVRFVDTRAVLGPGYRELDGTERLRRTDGLHLCPAGTIRLVEALLAAMGLEPVPGWQTGPWRSGPPAFDPAECPPVPAGS